ncbi:hypothetical protein [Pseudomonas tussilaginis]|uniref:hypothetical protein n=1 Tax=Pseudomonas putida TaxID=303 RepID=UPI002363410D|nr:hypothetical protein [Pseudomonas putida]MDD1979632.1 hypothetical protein [Pseudomonas putida]
MNELILKAKPLIEIIYFLSSTLLLIGVGFAYRQLTLIKTDMKVKNQRSAAEKAIEASERYFCEYISLSQVNFLERKELKIPVYKGPVGDFTPASIAAPLKELSRKRFSLMSWLPALNRLESIAAYFCTGVADEKVGFSVIGRTFCSSVELNYDIISLSRDAGTVDYWENIVKLYQLWRPRLTKAQLELEKKQMDEKISSLKQKSITPIGTEP